MAKKGRKVWRRIGSGLVGCSVVFVGFLFLTGPGKDIRNLWSNGTIPSLLFPPANRPYSANAEGNLKAIRTALMLYHDSEGQFPQGAGWMDAIENRMTASDMTGAESKKKLIRPDLANSPNEYGYALNDKASGKYKDDVGAKTVLVYESKQVERNAHGDAAKDKSGAGITVDGTIVH